MSGGRILAALAGTRAAGPARAVVNALLPRGRRVVAVRGGAARGLRMELDLRTEKAYWLGQYEPAAQEILRKHLEPGALMYDVGANIGFVSLCAVGLGAEVAAFELVDANVARLRRNVELNGAPVEIVEAAVWDADGEVSLVAGDTSSEYRAAPGSGVRAVTLDAFSRGRRPPALVKIDVEGAEARVLAGAARLLAEARPVVLCEVHGSEAESAVRALLRGYRLAQAGSRWRIVATPTV